MKLTMDNNTLIKAKIKNFRLSLYNFQERLLTQPIRNLNIFVNLARKAKAIFSLNIWLPLIVYQKKDALDKHFFTKFNVLLEAADNI